MFGGIVGKLCCCRHSVLPCIMMLYEPRGLKQNKLWAAGFLFLRLGQGSGAFAPFFNGSGQKALKVIK